MDFVISRNFILATSSHTDCHTSQLPPSQGYNYLQEASKFSPRNIQFYIVLKLPKKLMTFFKTYANKKNHQIFPTKRRNFPSKSWLTFFPQNLKLLDPLFQLLLISSVLISVVSPSLLSLHSSTLTSSLGPGLQGLVMKYVLLQIKQDHGLPHSLLIQL